MSRAFRSALRASSFAARTLRQQRLQQQSRSRRFAFSGVLGAPSEEALALGQVRAATPGRSAVAAAS